MRRLFAPIRRILRSALALALLCAGSAWSQGNPYKPEYRLGTAVGPAYAWGKAGAQWAQFITERTAGRIKVRVFPGSSATGGDPARELTALRDGSLDLSVGSALTWAAQIPNLGLFALPFLIPDSAALDRLLNSEVGPTLFRAIEGGGLVPLAWGDNGFRALSVADRPIRGPADLAGLRVRTSGLPPIDEALAAMGAKPVQMPFAPAQQAFLSGGLDGQDTNAPVYVASRAQTLGQKHILDWRIAAEPLVFAVSRAAWDGWSETDRAIVRQAAVDAASAEIVAARAAIAAAEATLTGELARAGVRFARPTASERAAFAEATRPVLEKWADKIGSGWVAVARATMAPAGPQQ